MDHQPDLPSAVLGTIENDVGSEVYQELLVDFLAQLPLYLIDLNAAAAVDDVPAARYVAHQIKGNALSFGAAGLDGLAERVLSIGKGESELLRPLVGEFVREVARLQASLGGASLETEVGSDAYQQLLADFLGHLPLQLGALRTAAIATDIPAARYVAHQIKGYALNLRADVLDGLADRLLQIAPDDGDLLRHVVAEVELEAACLQEEHCVSTLETDVGTEVYQELLTEFLGYFPLYLNGLHNAALMKDVPAARYVAHQIKGNALSFGAVRLDGLADRLLRIGKDESDSLQLLVGEIDREVACLRATLGR